jgi:hypothetical protein
MRNERRPDDPHALARFVNVLDEVFADTLLQDEARWTDDERALVDQGVVFGGVMALRLLAMGRDFRLELLEGVNLAGVELASDDAADEAAVEHWLMNHVAESWSEERSRAVETFLRLSDVKRCGE